MPNLSLQVRRLHDIGYSGLYMLIGFIPFVGGIWMIILMCTDSNPGPNRYGPCPKPINYNRQYQNYNQYQYQNQYNNNQYQGNQYRDLNRNNQYQNQYQGSQYRNLNRNNENQLNRNNQYNNNQYQNNQNRNLNPNSQHANQHRNSQPDYSKPEDTNNESSK